MAPIDANDIPVNLSPVGPTSDSYSPELIAMVRLSFPGDSMCLGLAERGDISLLPFLHKHRPSDDAVVFAEAIVETSYDDTVLEMANAVLRKVAMCDLCAKETMSILKLRFPHD